ncbi:unnamed protein product, partial [Pylaiella littoralis]
MRGLYKHLKGSVGLDGRPSGGQHFIQDENSVLLRSQSEIALRWKRFFSGLLNAKSPTLQPGIIEEVSQRPAAEPTDDRQVQLDSAPTLSETKRAAWGMQNWRAP